MEVLFSEIQRFRQWWLWLLLFMISAILVLKFTEELIFGRPLGVKPMADLALFISMLCVFGLLYFFWMIRLETQISKENIHIKFVPFLKKTVEWQEIEHVELIQYGFVGYGIRYSFKYGKIYNINGNKGLLLKLNDGSQFVLGTQKPEEMLELLEQFPSKKPSN